MYHGDIRLGDTIDLKFCTVTTTGAPTQLVGTPAVSAYPGNSTTEITAGITLTVDFDSRTGLNNVRIVASSGNGYATTTNYTLVITTGTVGGTSVVGYCIGSFSIENRSALMPTTAARTLDVTAGGEGGIDWANVGTPGSTVSLSATTIATATAVTTVNGLAANSITAASMAADASAEIADAVWDEDMTAHQTQGTAGQAIGDPGADTDSIWGLINTNLDATVSSRASQTSVNTIDDFLDTEIAAIQADTDDIQTRLPAALVGGRMDSSVGAVAAGVITATSIADDAITAAKIANGAIDAATFAAGAIDASAIATDAITSAELSSTAITEIADGILDRDMSVGTDSGSASVRTVRQALRALRNKASIAAGTLTVTKENDVTTSWTAAVTTTAGNPISEIDPA